MKASLGTRGKILGFSEVFIPNNTYSLDMNFIQYVQNITTQNEDFEGPRLPLPNLKSVLKDSRHNAIKCRNLISR